MKLTERKKGIVALIVLAVVFASMGIFARILSGGLELLQQVYLRVLLALVVGLAIFWKDVDFSKLKKITGKEWFFIILRSLSMYVFGVTLFTEAVIVAKYSNVAFITGLPLTALLGFILLKEQITLGKILFLLMGFVGVVFIGVSDISQLFIWGRGELIALVSAFFFSLSYVLRRWHSSLLNNKEITLLMFFISLIVLFVLSLLKGEGLPAQYALTSWTIVFALLGAGILNIVNLYLVNYGFEKVEAVLASNILMLESVFAIAIAILLYAEIPLPRELLGGGLILLSVYGMNEIARREKKT